MNESSKKIRNDFSKRLSARNDAISFRNMADYGTESRYERYYIPKIAIRNNADYHFIDMDLKKRDKLVPDNWSDCRRS